MYSNSSLNVSTTTRQSPCVDSGYIPSSRQFFQDLSPAERVIIIIMCCVLTPITVAIYTIHVHFLLQSKTHWMDRRSSVWILSLLPVTSLNSALTLCLPRLAAMSDLISSMNLPWLHDDFRPLGTTMLQSPHSHLTVTSQSTMLENWNIYTNLGPGYFTLQAGSLGPLWGCEHSPSSTQVCEDTCQHCPTLFISLVLSNISADQAAIVQVVAAMLSLALFMENNSHCRQMTLQNPVFHLCVVKCVSTLLAIYGFCLAVAATEPVWKPVDVTPKCAILLTWLCLFNGQGLIFALLDMYGIPACTGHLTSRVQGKAIMNMFMLTEILIMAAVARYSYHKFDLRSRDPGLFTDSKEMSGLEDRSCTDSPDTGTDPWASTGLTDSSLFLTDSSEMSRPEVEGQAGRRVVQQYGTITSSSAAQILTDIYVSSCGNVNTLSGGVNTSCGDVNLSVQQITDQPACAD